MEKFTSSVHDRPGESNLKVARPRQIFFGSTDVALWDGTQAKKQLCYI